MSDLSLRQSFADEEHLKTDHGETSIDKYSVRSSVQRQAMGVEVISPTASKNIKIVDKFELHDTQELKKESAEEARRADKRKELIDLLQRESSSRQATEDREPEKSVEVDRESVTKSPDHPERVSHEAKGKQEGQRDITPQSFR